MNYADLIQMSLEIVGVTGSLGFLVKECWLRTTFSNENVRKYAGQSSAESQRGSRTCAGGVATPTQYEGPLMDAGHVSATSFLDLELEEALEVAKSKLVQFAGRIFTSVGRPSGKLRCRATNFVFTSVGNSCYPSTLSCKFSKKPLAKFHFLNRKVRVGAVL